MNFKVAIYLVYFLFFLFSLGTSSEPKESFDPNQKIHPYYLNEMYGYNRKECEEKLKCKKQCPELKRGQGMFVPYNRRECIRLCDETSHCQLNSYP